MKTQNKIDNVFINLTSTALDKIQQYIQKGDKFQKSEQTQAHDDQFCISNRLINRHSLWLDLLILLSQIDPSKLKEKHSKIVQSISHEVIIRTSQYYQNRISLLKRLNSNQLQFHIQQKIRLEFFQKNIDEIHTYQFSDNINEKIKIKLNSNQQQQKKNEIKLQGVPLKVKKDGANWYKISENQYFVDRYQKNPKLYYNKYIWVKNQDVRLKKSLSQKNIKQLSKIIKSKGLRIVLYRLKYLKIDMSNKCYNIILQAFDYENPQCKKQIKKTSQNQ